MYQYSRQSLVKDGTEQVLKYPFWLKVDVEYGCYFWLFLEKNPPTIPKIYAICEYIHLSHINYFSCGGMF